MRAITAPNALHSLLRGNSPQYSSTVPSSLSQTVTPLGRPIAPAQHWTPHPKDDRPFSLRLGNRRPPANAAQPAKRRETGFDA